jgi:hypothetical protein
MLAEVVTREISPAWPLASPKSSKKIVECVEKLITPVQYLLDWKGTAALCAHRGQIVTFDEMHYQELAFAFSEVVAYPRKGGMMHASEKPGFSLKLLSQSLVGEKRLFQSDGRIQTLIDSLIDRAHTTLSKLANHAVPAL